MFDIFGFQARKKMNKRYKQVLEDLQLSDKELMQKDWEQVGKDMYKALGIQKDNEK